MRSDLALSGHRIAAGNHVQLFGHRRRTDQSGSPCLFLLYVYQGGCTELSVHYHVLADYESDSDAGNRHGAGG